MPVKESRHEKTCLCHNVTTKDASAVWSASMLFLYSLHVISLTEISGSLYSVLSLAKQVGSVESNPVGNPESRLSRY